MKSFVAYLALLTVSLTAAMASAQTFVFGDAVGGSAAFNENSAPTDGTRVSGSIAPGILIIWAP